MPDYFTLDELRARSQVEDVDKFSDEDCEQAAAYIVGVVEREVGVSFIERTVTDELHEGGGMSIALEHAYVRSVISASINGSEVTDRIVVSADSLKRRSAAAPVAWGTPDDDVLVSYVHGYSSIPPADVKEQCLKGTISHLLTNVAFGSINDRRSSTSGELGTTTYVIADKDHPTGYPEVDAMIRGWQNRLDVLGFA